jgi:hypothetical protein
MDDPERWGLATIVAPRGGRLIDTLGRGPVRRSVPAAGTGLVWRRAVRLARAPKAPILCRCRPSVSYTRRGTPVCSGTTSSANSRTPRPFPTCGRWWNGSRFAVLESPRTVLRRRWRVACGPVRQVSSLPSAGKHVGAARGSPRLVDLIPASRPACPRSFETGVWTLDDPAGDLNSFHLVVARRLDGNPVYAQAPAWDSPPRWRGMQPA